MTRPPVSESPDPSQKRRNPTGLVIIAVGLLILVISVGAYFRSDRATGIQPPQLNAPMSNFELTDLNGQWVALSDYHGQVVLVNAWATWCPPCKAEMPDLNDFYNQHGKEGFVVLAINAGEAPATVESFVREYGIDFPVLVDPDYRVLDSLKINTFPTSIIIDRDGIIRNIRVGVHTRETLASTLLPLLEE